MRIHHIVPLLLILLTAGSCKKWLNITPQSQIASQDLFKTQAGFEEALNGVYTRCGQSDIYGQELTCGLPDVLAQDYSLSTVNDPLGYMQSASYHYQDANFLSRSAAIWSGLYNAIVNCNLILANIDRQKGLFTGNEYALIKGEALALRAYLHFDALRLFGPSYVSNSNAPAVPYVTTYSNKVTALSTVSAVVKDVIADLEQAKTILAPADSIRNPDYVVGYPSDPTQTETSSTNLFEQNRRHRMNYYAVCGELARAYLFEGDNTDALSNALEVINAHKFPWTAQADFISADPTKQDLILYKELVFGWYIPWQTTSLQNLFQTGTAGLFLQPADAQFIYEAAGVGGEDLRYKEWMQINVSGVVQLMKYKQNPGTTANDPTANICPQMAPAIRLSEMYYIAAEASYDQDPATALGYVNTVRFQRGIGTPLTDSTKTQFLADLVREARKEFFGEGQIFYMYKRLNTPVIGSSGIVIPPSDQVFVWPLPVNETEFGG
jgi:hypothetical protein